MERILRSLLQINGAPNSEDSFQNWVKLQEHDLEFPVEEDNKIVDYLRVFYGQFSSPPDFTIIKEFFEKKDEIEVVSRLDEIKKSQSYIKTNFLSIIRAEQEQQQVKNFILMCRDASAIAEHGRNLEKPLNGKKILRGANDGLNFLFDKMGRFTQVESGEKLEGDISDDADEVIEEYDILAKTNKFAGRNLFGFDPVDSVCKGHRNGEFWVHCGFSGELKCLTGSSYIYDHAKKCRRTIQDIFDSDDLPVVTALDRAGESLKLVKTKASHIVQNGVRKVFELKLESGKKVTSTNNHKFYTLNGWKKLSDLKTGDWVAVPRKLDIQEPTSEFLDEEVKIIGYLIGDGCISKGISFCVANKEIEEDFIECIESMGYERGLSNPEVMNYRVYQDTRSKKTCNIHLCRNSNNKSLPISTIRSLIERLGLYGSKARTKKIPNSFFGLSDRQTALLLGALWSTDGSTHIGNHERYDRPGNKISERNDIKYYSISEQLCLDVQSLLLRFGIKSTVTNYSIDHHGPYDVFVTRVIGNLSKRIFCDVINSVGKNHRLDLISSRLSNRNDTAYPSEVIPNKSSAILKSGKKRFSSQIKLRYGTVCHDVLECFAKNNQQLQNIINGDVLWERIKSISYIGKEMTYDLEVPDHHSFVVNDIITHNTTTALNYFYNNTYLYGKNIFYAILEMPYKQLRRQLYLIHSSHGKFVTDWYEKDRKAGLPNPYIGLDYRRVRDGELSALDYERLKVVAQDFKATRKGHLYIWRPGDEVTISDIKRKSEMFHNKYGCDGIVIDHLGLVKPKYRSNDYVVSINGVVRESRMLALNFARGRTVPVLALFQLNRQGKLRADKSDGHYDFAAISYANEIEKSADVITYTYLNDQLRKDARFFMGCLKNRDNPIFDRMVGKILWNSKRMRALESGLLDMNNDRILSASKAITLTSEDLLA